MEGITNEEVKYLAKDFVSKKIELEQDKINEIIKIAYENKKK